jgi:hypothetical protein
MCEPWAPSPAPNKKRTFKRSNRNKKLCKINKNVTDGGWIPLRKKESVSLKIGQLPKLISNEGKC